MNNLLIEKQIDIGVCKISYLQNETFSNTPPILFLHGWGISCEPYREFLNLLAQSYPVIAPDLPSFAKSSYSSFLESYGRYAELLLTFLDQLNLDRVHLAGHSFGGGIAITIAAVAPSRVETLMLVGSTGIPTGSIFDVGLRRIVEMTLQIHPPKWYLQFIEIPIVFSMNLLFNTANLIQALFLSLEGDLRPLLPIIQAPCLLVWSKQDITEPLSIAEEFQHKIPNSRLVMVEEGYHEWGLLYPEKFSAILTNFLNHVTMIEQHV